MKEEDAGAGAAGEKVTEHVVDEPMKSLAALEAARTEAFGCPINFICNLVDFRALCYLDSFLVEIANRQPPGTTINWMTLHRPPVYQKGAMAKIIAGSVQVHRSF